MNQSVAQQELPAESIAFPQTFANEEGLHRLLARLRSEERLKWIEPEGYEPFWLVSHHADILAIEKDAKRFINAPRQALMSFAQQDAGRQLTGGVDPSKMMRNVAAMDGEEHRKYREIAQTYFTPKGLTEVVKGIEGLAAEFVDRMVTADGECDFAEIAMSYPLRVIMQMLGVPPEDEPMMLSLSQQTLTSQDPDFQQEGGPIAAIMRMVQYFSATVADRRANPVGDLASVIANARIDGEYLPDPDIFGYFFVVATAGHDTTSYAMTGGLLALINHPAEMQKLRENPSLLPNAVEEILRWTTPVKHFCRTATEDCEYAGKQIRKGDIILLSYPSANRDDEAFEDPSEFRIDRRPNRQLAFGTGPHVCLGQYLARFELISFFKELLNRVDDIELGGEPKFVEGTFVSGPKYLPIRYKTR
ncbi:MAG TPA: cytochrome P450 [Sphingobium sp.]